MPRDTGENATMAVSGYGTRSVLVESIGYGINIEAQTAEARGHRAFYTTRVNSSGFSIDLAFISYGRYQAWSSWMMEYLRRLAEGRYGPMRVRVPKFSFDRLGVPKDAVPFGDARNTLIHKVSMSFVGASDPTDASIHNKTVSQFRNAGKDSAIAPFFYPAGTQKAAGEGGDDYDWGQDIKDLIAMTDADNLAFEMNRDTGVGKGE